MGAGRRCCFVCLFEFCVFVPCFFGGEGIVLVSRKLLVSVPSSESSKLLCAFPTSPPSSVFGRWRSLGLQRVVQLWWIQSLDGWRFSPPRRKRVQWSRGLRWNVVRGGAYGGWFCDLFWFIYVRAGSICATIPSFLSLNLASGFWWARFLNRLRCMFWLSVSWGVPFWFV